MRRFVIAVAVFCVLVLASGAMAIAPGWLIQQTPGSTGGSGSGLDSVSCTSARACTAVGSHWPSAVRGVTLVERWNGTEWSIERTPSTGNSFLKSVSCVSASACTAVGSDSRGALVEGWNGTRWSIERTPSTGTNDSFLKSVSCVSASACTAVGAVGVGVLGNTGNTALVESWDGTQWSIEPGPSGRVGLESVSCVSASACTAVGARLNSRLTAIGTLAESWNGTEWSIERTPSPGSGSELSAVSCVSPNACTAVGDYSKGVLAERWNGTKWSIEHIPVPNGGSQVVLNSVSCVSARACTAVGRYSFSAEPDVTLAERWNGSVWSIEQTPSGSNQLNGVSCVSTSACTAVGWHNLPPHGAATGTLAERWRG